jgi:ABC-2 type transport system permease protein
MSHRTDKNVCPTKDIMSGLRLYFRYVGISARGQLQYRASFVMQSIGHFLITIVDFVGVWALFDRFGSIRGWTLAEAAVLYGLVSVTFAIADALGRGFDLFGSMVKAGDFDRLLLRPRSTVLQLMGIELTLRRVGRFAQGLIILAWGAAHADAAWSALSITLALLAIVGGVCLFLGLLVFQGTMAFWTTETLELMNSLTYGGVYASQFPLTIYRSWFRRFFTYVVPLGCVSYLPVVAILGKSDPLGTPMWVQWVAPLSGVAFLVVALQFWKLGVRRYVSTGS